jgi:Ni/Fe-hydrogenase subunit HybB-like protein
MNNHRWTGSFLLLLLLGILSMVVALKGAEPGRAWEIYLVNLLFWSGISQAGLILSAVMVMTGARWWSPLRSMANGMASFLPLSFLLFVLLFLFGKDLFPWIHIPDESKSPWLNWDLLVLRDIIGIGILYLMSFIFLYYSNRSHAGTDGDPGARKVIEVLSPVLVVVYTIVHSILAIDLVMSLSPSWYSTLFGGYFFIGNLYAGIATLAILAVVFKHSPDRGEPIGASHLHDLSKLLLVFCLITGDFFWSQFVVLWYGNIPEETQFLLKRIDTPRWAFLSGAVLLVAFVLPFILLLSRRVKINPKWVFGVSFVVLAGMWLERFVLVVPSVYNGDSIPLGWMELGISLGFFSLCAISYSIYFQSIPRPDL